MAATAITNTVLKFNEFSAMPATSAVHASDGASVSLDAGCERCLLIFENANASTAKTVTVKKGDALQATGDISVSIAAGAKYVAVIESGKFKCLSGANKGKVIITGTDANIKIACVVLP